MAKRRELRPVRPNAGVRANYAARLDKLVDQMAADVQGTVSAAYKRNPPEMAQDASPAMEMRAAMRGLSSKWLGKFSKLSQSMAQHFATGAMGATDSAMTQALRDGGFTVKFKLTAPMNDILQATVGENVSLIKSIPAEYLTQVEGAVMRSVSQGRDLSGLVDELKSQHGVTTRRAKLIALDQNNKATAAFQRARRDDLGITEARWKHSGAGRHPRPEHVAFSGTIYNVKEGALIGGKRIWPGTEINCRCYDVAVLPDLGKLKPTPP